MFDDKLSQVLNMPYESFGYADIFGRSIYCHVVSVAFTTDMLEAKDLS